MRIADTDLVTCQICDGVFTTLAGHLCRKHGVTSAEYQVQFPNSCLVGKSYEHRRTLAISMALSGVPFSDDRKRRLSGCQEGMKKPATSRALKGKPKSAEHVWRVSEALTGRRLSAEHRKATSDGWKRRLASDPEFRRKIIQRIDRARNKACGLKRDTKIELAVRSILDELGVPYAHQAKLPQLGPMLEGRTMDFVIPHLKLVIEADGCYWHGCMQCFPDAWETNKVQRNLLRRRQLVDGLSRIGWSILELSEHEINSDVDSVRRRISEAVKVY